MRYLTARKRAEGKGASHSGTEHHWRMQVSAAGLAVLVPTFIFMVGSAIGGTHAEVLESFSSPFLVILTALVLVVGMQHFASGCRMAIEDYTHGSMRKGLIMLVYGLSYAITATGLFALAKIAL